MQRSATCDRPAIRWPWSFVFDANARARRFYERAGFVVEATRLSMDRFDFYLTEARYGRSLSRGNTVAVMAEPLVLLEYDEQWPVRFGELRDRALALLEGIPVGVEHVGSTAVPGLVAKPVIELDVVVAKSEEVPAALERLAAVGYEVGGRSGGVIRVEGLVALGWPKGEQRHHLYVVVQGSAVHRERVAFRDVLRSQPGEREQYAALKARAARDSGGNWELYSQAKHEYVQRVLHAATAQLGGQEADSR